MYAYLAWVILLGVAWLAIYIIRKDLRKKMLATSLFFLPLGLTQPLFVPEYWNPIVIYKFLGLFDLESLMHPFFIGGISGASYDFLFTKKANHKKPALKRNLIGLILGVTIFLAAIKILSLSVIRSLITITALGEIYLLSKNTKLIKKSLITGIIIFILYALSLIIINSLFPTFTLSGWNSAGTLGIYFLNIPIEEYLFGFLFGIIGSIIYRKI